ncbi:MAG TPA: DUF1015 domain-containing protein [Clostridiales bacterium]|nr:DUF1015 domain-containing protein [Clostridiales bacterium]
MASVRPFAAVRPIPERAGEMLSLPYDVMDRREAACMAADKPASFLHITRSEINLPDTVGPYDNEVYKRARSNLDHFLENGWLIEDPRPCYYIYRQIMNGRRQTGLVGCVPIDSYLDGTIKQHELTRREKEADRIRHFDACDAHTEPVFLTFREVPGFTQTLEDWADRHEPVYRLTDPNKVDHILWVVDQEEMIERLTSLVATVPALYIADGHHRSASAAHIGEQRRQEQPAFSDAAEFNFFMAVLFPEQELYLMAYNRVVSGLNGFSESEFLDALQSRFDIEKIEEKNGPAKPDRKHVFTMYLRDCWYRLTAKPDIIPDDLIAGLDVCILQDQVLAPLLGITDPRTDQRIDFIGGIRGLEELERRVHDDMTVAFALYPVQIPDLMTISDENRIMPPKSTWFEPKLGSGLFIHRFTSDLSE